jgi:hypothetical protein
MRRFALIPVVVLGLAAVGTSAAALAPEQVRAAGLDFWNVSADEADLRAAEDESRDLEADHERSRQRTTVVTRIVNELSEDRVHAADALEELAAVARSSPEWFATLRTHYQLMGFVTPTATDHEVLIKFLLVRVQARLNTAEHECDAALAPVISARRVRLEGELRHLPSASAQLLVTR